jgi:hypothetical protein
MRAASTIFLGKSVENTTLNIIAIKASYTLVDLSLFHSATSCIRLLGCGRSLAWSCLSLTAMYSENPFLGRFKFDRTHHKTLARTHKTSRFKLRCSHQHTHTHPPIKNDGSNSTARTMNTTHAEKLNWDSGSGLGDNFIEPLLHRLVFSLRLYYLNRTANCRSNNPHGR